MSLWSKIKIVFFYAIVALIIFLLAIVNLYSAEVRETLPFLTDQGIVLFSFIVALLLATFFWHNEEEAEIIKYSFLTIATHKFRTPLTAIKWAADSLKKPLTNEEQQVISKQITQSNERLIQIVDILAGLAKMDDRSDYNMVAVSFREMLEETINKYAPVVREKGIKFNISIGEHIPLITVDTKRIQFGIEMIFENAVKYTPNNGQINVSATYHDKAVVLAVKDSGIGMSKRDKARLFKKFFRSEAAKRMDPEGMGLGLFITETIVRRHHGQIWAESSGLGKGTTFFMKLKINN